MRKKKGTKVAISLKLKIESIIATNKTQNTVIIQAQLVISRPRSTLDTRHSLFPSLD